MARAAHEIAVNAPIEAVYAQWTQFEEFPRFMEGVDEVRQLDDRRMHWRANIAGRDVEWDAEIREQVPHDKIVWRSIDGASTAGLVSFQPLDSGRTRVHLELSYEPEGALEQAGDALGIVERQVEGDLERFKDFIEARGGRPTGAWMGTITNEDAPTGHTRGMGSPDIPPET
ncbi:MAG: SRPBCC family protein [Dehalococcoidia bacterium]